MKSPQTTALKVLVIDDHKAHAEGLAELLQLAGFEASLCADRSRRAWKTRARWMWMPCCWI
jgi:DNA-binding NarL/FixJ family response regulator